MTTEEIKANRDYIYGYYCGRIGAVMDNPSLAWDQGWADACNDDPEDSFVSTQASRFAQMNVHGLIIGSITPRTGLCLYYLSAENDCYAETRFWWDTTRYTSSGKQKGWQLYNG